GGMESVLIAVVLAAAQPHAPIGDAATALDQRCFSLMAQLAEDQDPRVQSLGRVAARYFLGRIGAASPGFDPARAAPPEPGNRAEPLDRMVAHEPVEPFQLLVGEAEIGLADRKQLAGLAPAAERVIRIIRRALAAAADGIHQHAIGDERIAFPFVPEAGSAAG